jgi:hypothetical protein
MRWLNILGMTLQFFSFWFAAPEILGEEKLKHYENKIKRYLSNLPTLIFGVPSIILIFIFFGSGGKSSGSGEFSIVLLILAFIFRNRLKKRFEEKVMKPFLDTLIENDDKRQNYLRIAAALFTAGFICSIMATALNE